MNMQDERIYQEDFVLRYRDVDMYGRWKPESIFILMQEVSDRHAAALQGDRSVLIEQGIAWVLSRMHVQMSRYPRVLESVSMTTWPGEGNRFMFSRHYRFTDDGGREIGRATSIWVLLDVHTRKALPAARLPVPLPDTSDIPAPLGQPKKLKAPDCPLQKVEYRARYEDYDINGHVNNTRYAAWFSDLSDISYHADHVLADFQVNYSQEIRPGAEIILEYARQDDVLYCQGSQGQTQYFQAQGIFARAQN
jgi:medium-chain acyl-[acyl-carrier-protein] hydrolase